MWGSMAVDCKSAKEKSIFLNRTGLSGHLCYVIDHKEPSVPADAVTSFSFHPHCPAGGSSSQCCLPFLAKSEKKKKTVFTGCSWMDASKINIFNSVTVFIHTLISKQSCFIFNTAEWIVYGSCNRAPVLHTNESCWFIKSSYTVIHSRSHQLQMKPISMNYMTVKILGNAWAKICKTSEILIFSWICDVKAMY